MAADGNLIRSRSNPRVKHAVALRDRRHRDRQGQLLIEGGQEVHRAIAAGFVIDVLFTCPVLTNKASAENLLIDCSEAGAQLLEVTEGVFEKIALRNNPDGILAIARQPETNLSRLRLGRDPLIVVAVGLEKPGNLGAVLRTADAVGAQALLLCDRCTDMWNPNVIRASLGTVFTVPLAEEISEHAVPWLKERSFRIVAASPQADRVYTEVDLSGPVALVVGEEHGGLEEPWRSGVDVSVRIPMRGSTDSLNVSAAAAVLLYEADRQRRGG